MTRISLSLLALTLSSSLAFSAGSSSGNNTPAPKTPAMSPKMLKCKTGQVVQKMMVGGKVKMKCAKAKAEYVPDDELYQQGYMLAKSGDYDWAIEVLSAIQNQDDPDVLNMLGYSNRKAGRVELGISYYGKALAMKPDFVRAREYLGEGYVAAGKLDLAKAQLNEIAKYCGNTTCEEYQDLSKVINAAL